MDHMQMLYFLIDRRSVYFALLFLMRKILMLTGQQCIMQQKLVSLLMRQTHLQITSTSMNRKFEFPRVELEQYSTSPNLARCEIQEATQNGDLGEGCAVCELGCSTVCFPLYQHLKNATVQCPQTCVKMQSNQMQSTKLILCKHN